MITQSILDQYKRLQAEHRNICEQLAEADKRGIENSHPLVKDARIEKLIIEARLGTMHETIASMIGKTTAEVIDALIWE